MRVALPAALLSPNLNPIEEAFSKVKGIVRKAGARTRPTLEETVGEALSFLPSPKTRQAGSGTAATIRWINRYEYRCETLVEAMSKALGAVSARDTRGFFEHSGYRALGQPF